MTSRSRAIGLARPRPPREPKRATLATMARAPASVAATVLVRVSRFFTWDSSWAMTPSSSSSSSCSRIPTVAATAACFGLRPVAKALGVFSGIRYTLGIGSPDFAARRETIPYSRGCSFSPTSWAR